MSYTKGPWILDTRDMVVRAGDMRVADIRGWGMLQYKADGEAEMDANARLIAAAPKLLKACESVGRLVEIGIQKSSLESRRRGGSFGIAVDTSPIGVEWQALDAEERAIMDSIRAAIRAAREG